MIASEPSKLHLLTPREAAKELGVSPGTLAIWRCKKRYSLRYYKVGYRVRYRMKDIESFIESRSHS
jgi:excisionase family DNA binding protein